MNEERPSFSAVLHEAAESFDPPDLDVLCAGAVSRGRRTVRRRQTFGASIGVLALAGAGFGLAGTMNGSPATGPATTPVVTPSSGHLGEYMAKNFMALLPKGIELATDGIVPLTGQGYAMPSNGEWSAGAALFGTYQGKKINLQLNVIQQQVDRGCIGGLPASAYACATATVDGRTLVIEENKNGGDDSWSYMWNLGGGKAVQFTASPTLSLSEAEKVVTAPAWTSVLRGLPAYVECPTLTQIKQANGWVWKCPTTGKTYPTMPSDFYGYTGTTSAG